MCIQLLKSKMKTEADMVMDDVGIMAQITLNGNATWISPRTHYLTENNRLYIDLPVLFATYRHYKTACREKLVIENQEQFRQLIAQEPYFITDTSIEGAKALCINRAVLELDMNKMLEKGLDVSMYG